MVDWFGRWIVEENYDNYPEEKMCDNDYLAERLIADEYKPKTSIEHVVEMVWSFFDEDAEQYGYNRYSVDDCYEYVMESGGWQEFDYYC